MEDLPHFSAFFRILLAICWKLCYAAFGAASTPVGGSPRIFSGVIYFFCPQSQREGVSVMDVTWEEIFQFCTFVVAVISLVLQANGNKKK